jgi:hypothetical protein
VNLIASAEVIESEDFITEFDIQICRILHIEAPSWHLHFSIFD